jgi:hypothetical protein
LPSPITPAAWKLPRNNKNESLNPSKEKGKLRTKKVKELSGQPGRIQQRERTEHSGDHQELATPRRKREQDEIERQPRSSRPRRKSNEERGNAGLHEKPPQQDTKKSNILVASITSLRRKSNREGEGSSGGQGETPPTRKGGIEHSERGKHTNTKAPAADSFRGQTHHHRAIKQQSNAAERDS